MVRAPLSFEAQQDSPRPSLVCREPGRNPADTDGDITTDKHKISTTERTDNQQRHWYTHHREMRHPSLPSSLLKIKVKVGFIHGFIIIWPTSYKNQAQGESHSFEKKLSLQKIYFEVVDIKTTSHTSGKQCMTSFIAKPRFSKTSIFFL